MLTGVQKRVLGFKLMTSVLVLDVHSHLFDPHVNEGKTTLICSFPGMREAEVRPCFGVFVWDGNFEFTSCFNLSVNLCVCTCASVVPRRPRERCSPLLNSEIVDR